MSENWKLQLSLKIDGQHLLNLRAETSEELSGQLAWATENKEQLLIACAVLGGAQRHEPARPAAPLAPAPSTAPSAPQQVPAASYVTPPGAGEVGPVLLRSVKKDLFNKDGVKMNSPKYTFEFGDGKKLATFKEVWGKAGETLAGEMVFYSVETRESNGKTYSNLAEVRMAS
jgi:hypothetical protein